MLIFEKTHHVFQLLPATSIEAGWFSSSANFQIFTLYVRCNLMEAFFGRSDLFFSTVSVISV